MTEIDDDGYLTVKLAGVEKKLDLWHVNNRLVELQEESEGKPANVFNDAVVAYLLELGYPQVSGRAACKFAEAIYTARRELEKKDESPESPSPNAS